MICASSYVWPLLARRAPRMNAPRHPCWCAQNKWRVVGGRGDGEMRNMICDSNWGDVWLSRNTNKMQLCNRIYYSKVTEGSTCFERHRSSSGTLKCICSLWIICPCGDRSLWRLSGTCDIRMDSGNAATCSGSLLKYLMISFIPILYHKVCEQIKDEE